MVVVHSSTTGQDRVLRENDARITRPAKSPQNDKSRSKSAFVPGTSKGEGEVPQDRARMIRFASNSRGYAHSHSIIRHTSRDVSDLVLAKISRLESQGSVENTLHKDTQFISAEAQQKADLQILETIKQSRKSENEELLTKADQQKNVAFLWSSATVAAVKIQKHWKRHKAEKNFIILRRRSQLAKRAQSIKRHMERKWRWTDAIQSVIDKPRPQRPHPEQRSEMPEQISTANTVSQSNTTASGWGRLNAAAALEKAGSGARRLHSQASSNKSGHESWGELLTGLVTNPRQDTRGNLAPDQISKFSAVLETLPTAKKPDLSGLTINTSPRASHHSRFRTHAAHAPASASLSPQPRGLQSSPQHTLDQASKSSEDHATTSPPAKTNKRNVAEPEMLLPIQGAAPGKSVGSCAAEDTRNCPDVLRPRSAVGVRAESELAAALDAAQRKRAFHASQPSSQGSRPSSAAESKSSDHFHQAGSELQKHSVHELHAYHPRVLESPQGYSRSLQNMCMHITSPNLPCASKSESPTRSQLQWVAGDQTAPASSSSYVRPGSRPGPSIADGACVTGVQVSDPSQKPQRSEDGSPGPMGKGKRGKRCWSAGAADQRARHVKQTLVRRPSSAAHTHVVPTQPAAMRLQPQIAGMHGKQQLHAHYEAATVSEGHDGRAPRAVLRDEPMAPFDMLLFGNTPMAKVGGLVATGSFNKEHLGAERGADGMCQPGHDAPATGDATREAPAPQCPTERQLKPQKTPETSTGAGPGQCIGQRSATPNTSTYEASSTAQRTAAMWSSYRKQLVSAPASLQGPGACLQDLEVVLCGTQVLPPTDAIESTAQAGSCTGVQQSAASHFAPYDSSLAQFAQLNQAFNDSSLTAPSGTGTHDQDAPTTAMLPQEQRKASDDVEVKAIRHLYGSTVTQHSPRDVFAETAAPIRSSVTYEAPTPPPTAACGLDQCDISSSPGSPQRPCSSRSVFSHSLPMHQTGDCGASAGRPCHISDAHSPVGGSHGTGGLAGSQNGQVRSTHRTAGDALREADAERAKAAWSEWLADGRHSGTARCSQSVRQQSSKQQKNCRNSPGLGLEAAVIARRVGSSRACSRARPSTVHSAQKNCSGGAARRLHTSESNRKANEGLFVARIPDGGGFRSVAVMGSGAEVHDNSSRGSSQPRKPATPLKHYGDQLDRAKCGQDALVVSVYRARVHEQAVRDQETILMRPQDAAALRCSL